MLFILALVAGVKIRDWKILLGVISTFTISHSFALALAVTGWVEITESFSWWIELLIPITILFTGISNMTSVSSRYRLGQVFVFGLIHGLGFSNYLKMILGQSDSLAMSLFGFNIGLELGQLIFLCLVLVLIKIFEKFFQITKRDRNIFVSGGVILASSLLIIEKLFV